VNPSQFGPAEDFGSYPRDLDRDVGMCEASGVDFVFAPTAQDMYGAGQTVHVEEQDLAAGLCGGLRPGHFRGVLTVVAKLFNIVLPDVAVFGQKDAQQARLIQQMARDLNFPVNVVIAPTVREPDGLAMSSRNVYLSPDERRRATSLYRALRLAEEMVKSGRADAGQIRLAMRAVIDESQPTEVQYIDVVSYQTLKPVTSVSAPALIAVAVKFGNTRLIDNTIVGR
jgi:pantoate--beta-alanine ligase